MSSVTRRPRNARGQGERLRGDLLTATLTSLATTGDPEDVSIRAVAKATGVSPTAVYQHFADRDDLLAAACDCAFEKFAAVLIEATRNIDDPFERLAAAGQSYLDYARTEPGLYRVLFSNPLHFGHHDLSAKLAAAAAADDSAGSNAFVVLVDMVQGCLDAGAPALGAGGTGAPDAVYLSFQVWSWLHGIVDLSITHPQMPWPPAEDLVRDVQRVLGLTAPQQRPPRSTLPNASGRG